MEEFRFVLLGVHQEKFGEAKNVPKFVTSKAKAKGGKLRVQSFNTQDGYTVKIANTECVSFSEEGGETLTASNCWHDKQPFDEEPICIPYEYSVKKDHLGKKMHTFRGPGSFCSIFCLWAYLSEELRKQYYARDPRIEKAVQHTRLAFGLMFDDGVTLKAAPDWRLLDCFGGHLPLSEFRQASYNKTYVKMPNLSFEPSGEKFMF